MIGELKRYAEYRDSGHQWLGEIPSHWNIASLGSLTWPVAQRGRADLPLLSVVRERGVIPRSTMTDSENHNFVPDDLSNYKLARAGSLVINKMKAWQGSLGIAPIDGIVSPAYFVFDFNIADTRYGQALLRSRTYVAFFARVSDGVRIGQWDLSIDGMKRIPMPIPPVPEQAAIVRFLNHADRRIRRYIGVKKKLIALLNEQKLAIIQTAVTRGLDPNVRLKPSSVAWLGDVPQHWKVTRLKFEASEIVDCLHATPRYVEAGDHPAIRTADIEPGRVRLAKARKVDEDEYLRWTSRLAPKPGDILYSREGERYGIAALVPDGVALCISQRMMIFRIASRHSSAFIMWQLNSRQVYDQAAADQIGATAPHINVDRIKNYWLTLPPVDEQVAIARHIEARCRSLEASIERIEQESALIREYRVRLIADVVTGKLDVREAAEGLPDESESDPVDDVLAHVDVEGDIEEIVEGAGG